MYCVSVLYPNTPGGRFDFEYYRSQHLPMVLELLGDNVQRLELRRGLVALDGSPAAYLCLLNAQIRSKDDFLAVLNANAERVLGDLPNYTNLQPLIQVDEILA
ncbi:MAG: EthD family reductase [Pseudomonas sp.]